MEKMIKFQIKINNDWTHIAYIPEELKERFSNKLKEKSTNDWVNKWVKEDFGVEFIDTHADLRWLKGQIKSKYRELYPELFIGVTDSKVDTQGWSRVWVMTKMLEEMEN